MFQEAGVKPGPSEASKHAADDYLTLQRNKQSLVDDICEIPDEISSQFNSGQKLGNVD